MPALASFIVLVLVVFLIHAPAADGKFAPPRQPFFPNGLLAKGKVARALGRKTRAHQKSIAKQGSGRQSAGSERRPRNPLQEEQR